MCIYKVQDNGFSRTYSQTGKDCTLVTLDVLNGVSLDDDDFKVRATVNITMESPVKALESKNLMMSSTKAMPVLTYWQDTSSPSSVIAENQNTVSLVTKEQRPVPVISGGYMSLSGAKTFGGTFTAILAVFTLLMQ
uniref:Uncharacterized protein n=1 Tax=Favella ehrenbergii TaxID=182087 RepID=A0A7S3IAC9_9SPIT|mmetsp:Transcript_9784/g.12083  ORF Transcript_9784/g.12083 Transcript_9784/m.12083 type:complete len:136 (+) Transcript_9784:444-851(+)